MTRRFHLRGFVLLSTVLGCSGEPQAPALSAADLVGTFYLDSIQGQPLPFHSGNSTYHLALLTLNSDETIKWLIDTSFCTPTPYCNEAMGGPTGGQWLLLTNNQIQVTGSGEVTDNTNRAEVTRNRLQFGSAIYKRVGSGPNSVTQIDIRPDSFNLRVGQSQNVFATTYPYVPSVIIQVRDTSIASLGAIAITARKPGTTYVIAQSGTTKDSSRVTVIP